MARIIFTEAAARMAERLLETSSQKNAPAILSIRWSRGLKDNRRGPRGETVWLTIEPPGWRIHVAAGAQPPGSPLDDYTLTVNGIPVLLDAKATEAAGVLLVKTAYDGSLCVESALH